MAVGWVSHRRKPSPGSMGIATLNLRGPTHPTSASLLGWALPAFDIALLGAADG